MLTNNTSRLARVLALVLAVLMVLAVCLTGCTDATAQANADKAQKTAEDAAKAAEEAKKAAEDANSAIAGKISDALKDTLSANALAAYLTSADFDKAIASYAKADEVKAQIATLAAKGDLEAYLKKADLDGALGTYMKTEAVKDYVAAQLKNYSTSTEVALLLADYAKKADLSSYKTAAEVANDIKTAIETFRTTDLAKYDNAETVALKLANKLNDYVAKADLTAYDTAEQVAQKLKDTLTAYATDEELAAAVATLQAGIDACVTKEEIKKYSNSEEVAAKIVAELAGYVKTETLDAAKKDLEEQIKAVNTLTEGVKADLKNYVLSTTLDDYTTAAALAETLKAYSDTAAVKALIADAKTALETAIAEGAKAAAEKYAVAAEVAEELKNCVKTADLEKTLENYQTVAQVTEQLQTAIDGVITDKQVKEMIDEAVTGLKTELNMDQYATLAKLTELSDGVDKKLEGYLNMTKAAYDEVVYGMIEEKLAAYVTTADEKYATKAELGALIDKCLTSDGLIKFYTKGEIDDIIADIVGVDNVASIRADLDELDTVVTNLTAELALNEATSALAKAVKANQAAIADINANFQASVLAEVQKKLDELNDELIAKLEKGDKQLEDRIEKAEDAIEALKAKTANIEAFLDSLFEDLYKDTYKTSSNDEALQAKAERIYDAMTLLLNNQIVCDENGNEKYMSITEWDEATDEVINLIKYFDKIIGKLTGEDSDYKSYTVNTPSDLNKYGPQYLQENINKINDIFMKERTVEFYVDNGEVVLVSVTPAGATKTEYNSGNGKNVKSVTLTFLAIDETKFTNADKFDFFYRLNRQVEADSTDPDANGKAYAELIKLIEYRFLRCKNSDEVAALHAIINEALAVHNFNDDLVEYEETILKPATKGTNKTVNGKADTVSVLTINDKDEYHNALEAFDALVVKYLTDSAKPLQGNKIVGKVADPQYDFTLKNVWVLVKSVRTSTSIAWNAELVLDARTIVTNNPTTDLTATINSGSTPYAIGTPSNLDLDIYEESGYNFYKTTVATYTDYDFAASTQAAPKKPSEYDTNENTALEKYDWVLAQTTMAYSDNTDKLPIEVIKKLDHDDREVYTLRTVKANVLLNTAVVLPTATDYTPAQTWATGTNYGEGNNGRVNVGTTDDPIMVIDDKLLENINTKTVYERIAIRQYNAYLKLMDAQDAINAANDAFHFFLRQTLAENAGTHFKTTEDANLYLKFNAKVVSYKEYMPNAQTNKFNEDHDLTAYVDVQLNNGDIAENFVANLTEEMCITTYDEQGKAKITGFLLIDPDSVSVLDAMKNALKMNFTATPNNGNYDDVKYIENYPLFDALLAEAVHKCFEANKDRALDLIKWVANDFITTLYEIYNGAPDSMKSGKAVDWTNSDGAHYDESANKFDSFDSYEVLKDNLGSDLLSGKHEKNVENTIFAAYFLNGKKGKSIKVTWGKGTDTLKLTNKAYEGVVGATVTLEGLINLGDADAVNTAIESIVGNAFEVQTRLKAVVANALASANLMTEDKYNNYVKAHTNTNIDITNVFSNMVQACADGMIEVYNRYIVDAIKEAIVIDLIEDYINNAYDLVVNDFTGAKHVVGDEKEILVKTAAKNYVTSNALYFTNQKDDAGKAIVKAIVLEGKAIGTNLKDYYLGYKLSAKAKTDYNEKYYFSYDGGETKTYFAYDTIMTKINSFNTNALLVQLGDSDFYYTPDLGNAKSGNGNLKSYAATQMVGELKTLYKEACKDIQSFIINTYLKDYFAAAQKDLEAATNEWSRGLSLDQAKKATWATDFNGVYSDNMRQISLISEEAKLGLATLDYNDNNYNCPINVAPTTFGKLLGTVAKNPYAYTTDIASRDLYVRVLDTFALQPADATAAHVDYSDMLADVKVYAATYTNYTANPKIAADTKNVFTYIPTTYAKLDNKVAKLEDITAENLGTVRSNNYIGSAVVAFDDLLNHDLYVVYTPQPQP